MAFQGTLYITDKHACFNVEEKGRKLPISIPHTSLTRVERTRIRTKGGATEQLRLGLQENQWVAMKDFKFGELESALGLLEHLTS